METTARPPMPSSTQPPDSQQQSLLDQLCVQLEFYFSESNLARDNFLQAQLAHHYGTVPVHLVADFRKMRTLLSGTPQSDTLSLMMRAVQGSSVVQVTPDGLYFVPLAAATVAANAHYYQPQPVYPYYATHHHPPHQHHHQSYPSEGGYYPYPPPRGHAVPMDPRYPQQQQHHQHQQQHYHLGFVPAKDSGTAQTSSTSSPTTTSTTNESEKLERNLLRLTNVPAACTRDRVYQACRTVDFAPLEVHHNNDDHSWSVLFGTEEQATFIRKLLVDQDQALFGVSVGTQLEGPNETSSLQQPQAYYESQDDAVYASGYHYATQRPYYGPPLYATMQQGIVALPEAIVTTTPGLPPPQKQQQQQQGRPPEHVYVQAAAPLSERSESVSSKETAAAPPPPHYNKKRHSKHRHSFQSTATPETVAESDTTSRSESTTHKQHHRNNMKGKKKYSKRKSKEAPPPHVDNKEHFPALSNHEDNDDGHHPNNNTKPHDTAIKGYAAAVKKPLEDGMRDLSLGATTE